MRKLTALCFALLLILLAGCKNKKKDNSLQEGIMAAQDTVRVNKLLRTAYEISKTSPDSAELLYNQIIHESQKCGYNDGTARAVLSLMVKKFETGRFDSGEYYYSIAEKAATGPHFQKDLYPELMMNKGSYYYFKGEKVNADKAYLSGLAKLKELNMGKEKMAMMLLYNLHFSKVLMKEYDLALGYLNEADTAARHIKDSGFIKSIMICKANIYIGEKKMDSAASIINQVIAESKGQLSANDIMVIKGFYSRLKTPEKAIPVILNGINDFQERKIDFSRLAMNIVLGEVYNELHRFKEAERILKPTLKETIEKKFDLNMDEAYTTLSEACAGLGDYKTAASLERARYNWRDSSLGQKTRTELNELNLKYKTAEKDKEISQSKLRMLQQESQLSRQRIFIIVIFSCLAFAVFLVYLLRRNTIQKEKIRQQELVSLQQSHEINTLAVRMNGEESERQRLGRDLHDGIGAMVSSALMHLDSLKNDAPSLAETNTYKTLTNILEATAVDVKRTAYNLVPATLLKAGLAEAIQDFIVSLKKPPQLQFHVETHGALDQLSYNFQMVVYRIVQELSHNIVKHANANKAIVQLTMTPEYFTITVEDDGTGIQNRELAEGHGLRNIQYRVEKLGGTISIDSSEGTTIFIEFSKSVFNDFA